MAKQHKLSGILGDSGTREVFLGFAPANLLHELSIADILNEDTGEGYQRRFNNAHSLDFRRYARQPGSTTIPLTFNLRPEDEDAWSINRGPGNKGELLIRSDSRSVMYQVDCQHRLGYLGDVDVPLAFMVFIGLTPLEEMEVFSVINGKSKGLSTSLLDYHDAQLARDLKQERPELYVALQLNEDPASPWYRQLDLGGQKTSGIQRRASLRTVQKAVKRFLNQTQILNNEDPSIAYAVLRDFWRAVTVVLEREWGNPRKHFLTKGVGVYSLMTIAGDLYQELAMSGTDQISERYFVEKLSDFLPELDWSSTGPLKGLGGEAGVTEAVQMLRELKRSMTMRVIQGGK